MKLTPQEYLSMPQVQAVFLKHTLAASGDYPHAVITDFEGQGTTVSWNRENLSKEERLVADAFVALIAKGHCAGIKDHRQEMARTLTAMRAGANN